jgi:hypothetical protein
MESTVLYTDDTWVKGQYPDEQGGLYGRYLGISFENYFFPRILEVNIGF